MLPDFLVIGAPKCGTTSLCHLLGKHPQVFMPEVKEPHFFGRNDPLKTLSWYEDQFKGAEGYKAVGEGSTSYTHPHIIHQAAMGISRLIPHCRLIYITRNPIKRLESDWKMREREGWAEGKLNEAVKRQETLVGHGKYWQNISVYREFFPDSQILNLFLEDFSQNPMLELKRCFYFLAVDTSMSISDADKPLNESTQYRKDGLVAKYARQIPFFNLLKKVTPTWIFNMAKLSLTYKHTLKVKWDPHVKKAVIEQLIDDSHQFLDYCGKPYNFWDLEQ